MQKKHAACIDVKNNQAVVQLVRNGLSPRARNTLGSLLTVPNNVITNIFIIIIIIIFTTPKPAYGRQGLAGSWGQDTDKVSNFWVFLTSHFAQLGNKPTWDHS